MTVPTRIPRNGFTFMQALGRRSPDLPWLLLLLAMPVLVHLPELAGLISSDPLLLVSGLGIDVPGGVLLPGQPGWIDGNAGVTVQALGRLVARDWAHGIVPWWNPYAGLGVPLAGEYQPAAFFLPWVLLLGFDNGVLLLKVTLQIVAGLGCWGLGRRLGFVRPVAAMSGLLFAFNGSFAWASDAPIQPMAFLPLILLGVEQARDRAGWTGGWLTLGFGLGWSLLAGFPETAFLDGLLVLAWSLVRLVGQGRNWPGLARRLALGGVFGLLLAGPQLVAFIDFLPDAFVGSHAGPIVSPLPAAGFAMWLMPWLHGPIQLDRMADLWFGLGGYLGAAPVLLAGVGLAVRGGRERALRWMLVDWVVLVVGKTAELQPFAALADAIPMMTHAVVSRYATASVELAIILLACFTVDDWCRSRILTRKRIAIGLAGFSAIVLLCLVLAWPVSRTRLGIPWLLSLSLLVMVAGTLTTLLGRPATRRRLGGVALVAVGEALILFAVPLASGRTGGHLDTGTIAFLRANLGLQRFTTLGGALVPNYGAYWGLASINHNLIPVPRRWSDYLHRAIDPDSDPVQFYGADGGNLAGIRRRATALALRIDALAALGVRYLLQDRGHDWLAVPAVPEDGRADAGFTGLDGSNVLTATYPHGPPPTMQVGRLSVMLGTFQSRSSGPLLATLCNGTDCAHGSADLETAVDNGAMSIRLDRTVTIRPDQPFRLTLAHPNGARVAIWLWHRGEAVAPSLPRLGLQDGFASRLALVHRGEAADIYALPDPAAYAEVDGPCQLQIVSRTRMIADCTASGTLVRRELFLPGWTFRIAGVRQPVAREGELFQSAALPIGHSEIEFAYAPPHAMLGWCALLLALAMLGGNFGSRLARRPTWV
ncbi:MAG: hypothetical protein ACRYGI_18410 [Janthinobacterium lividum]